MMAATKTAAPTRGRAATAKSSATKPAAATTKPATPKAAPATDEDLAKVGPIPLDFSHETKNFAVFTPPKDSGCVGSFYAPVGTTEVRVMLYGPTEALAE